MKIHDVKQKSVEWMILRSGLPTASEFDALLTPLFKVKTGEGPKTYLHKKLAEWWQGGPLLGFNVFDMDQGQMLEEQAVPWYELEFNTKIDRVGFCTTDDGRVGCSPDGLLGDDSGIEIKCPAVHTHVGYLLAGVIPPDYAAQVHGCMYVTGRKSWKFLSHRRHFPPLVLEIPRDEEIQEKINEAIQTFLEQFEEGKQRLIEINGGPPKRVAYVPPQQTAPEQKPEPAYMDVIP